MKPPVPFYVHDAVLTKRNTHTGKKKERKGQPRQQQSENMRDYGADDDD